MEYKDIIENPLFETYFDMLYSWNQKINLTAIISKEDVYIKHFLDSALPIELIPNGCALLDIGSGAGFPAVPLKILRPDLNIFLVDSVRKKVDFLDELIRALGLKDIKALHTRIEDFKQRDFDVVTSRAVAPLNTLLEYCLPFVKVGGFMLAYKGIGLEKELELCTNALTVLGGEVENIVERQLTHDTIRRFAVIRKIKKSPPQYPRSGNKPRLSPL